jgi:tetratricopeptide (TPR) repeat protein
VGKKAKGKTILISACVTGLVFVAVFLGFTLRVSRSGDTRREEFPSDFYKNLNLFDAVLQRGEDEGGVNHEHISNLLEVLSKSAIGAESRLSFLKRYRNLSGLYPEYFEGYSGETLRAAKKFPHSALIAALYAEAALSPEAEAPGKAEKIRAAAALLTESGPLSEPAFFPAAFCLYALNGDFHDIDSATAVKRAGELFTAFSNSLPAEDGDDLTKRAKETMLVDAALIGIVNEGGNEAAALARLEPRKVVLTKTLDFMANYAYDFANTHLAAELWSSMGTEKDFARAASALYIAGDTEKAKSLWLLLIKDVNQPEGENTAAEAKQKALYNLASIASKRSEKIAYAEKLLSVMDYDAVNSDVLSAAVILYTRLLPAERALSILSGFKASELVPLLDMEYQRRAFEAMPVDRSIAETWLLLNRHPHAEGLYRWAAWYFEYQRGYEEIKALRHFAAQNRIENPFLTFHYALDLVRDGDMAAGKDLFTNNVPETMWQRYANIALILDACHEYAAALKHYEAAAALIEDESALRSEAARIYLKLARCRGILGGRHEEIRRDLERAYALDSENVDVRLALRRL